MKHSVKHYLFKLKWIVAIIIFVVFTGFVGENCLVNRMVQKQEIAELRHEIDEYTRKFESDKKAFDRIKKDEDAVAEIARMKYYMKQEDEDIFVFEE